MTEALASIIIRCYNEREHIGKLLSGIFEQAYEDIEVILVDSGSTDGTIEVAKNYPIDEVVYIAPEEFSFGRALNYGCEAANGDFCVFASAHVYPKRRDWLKELLSKFEDSDVALAYGKQRGNDTTKFAEKQVFRQWFPEGNRIQTDSPFCNNANAAIRRELWEEFPYNEELTGLEDIDWAKRVQEAGYKVAYASNATIVHVHEESPREVYNRYRREAIALKRILPEQSFTFLDFVSMFFRNVISDYRAAVTERELSGSILGIPRFRLMQFWGTYMGFSLEEPVSERVWRRFYYPDKEHYPSTPNREQASEESQDGLEIDYSHIQNRE